MKISTPLKFVNGFMLVSMGISIIISLLSIWAIFGGGFQYELEYRLAQQGFTLGSFFWYLFIIIALFGATIGVAIGNKVSIFLALIIVLYNLITSVFKVNPASSILSIVWAVLFNSTYIYLLVDCLRKNEVLKFKI